MARNSHYIETEPTMDGWMAIKMDGWMDKWMNELQHEMTTMQLHAGHTSTPTHLLLTKCIFKKARLSDREEKLFLHGHPEHARFLDPSIGHSAVIIRAVRTAGLWRYSKYNEV